MPTNKQRRETARRRLELQLAERQERTRRRRRSNIIAGVVGAVVTVAVIVAVVIFTSNDKKSPTAAASGGASTTAATSVAPSDTPASGPFPCTFKTSGTAAKKNTKPANLKPARTGTVNATVKTTQGTMTFTLNRAEAPCAVESFLSLASQNYFNNTKCHRLTTSTSGIYVLQCGDPLANGSGGPGYTINDEYTGKEKYTAGTLAMANTGAADSGGSQFFIVYKDTALPPKYAVFGTVSAGMSVVDKVAAAGAAGTTGDGAPKLAITIQSVIAPAKA